MFYKYIIRPESPSLCNYALVVLKIIVFQPAVVHLLEWHQRKIVESSHFFLQLISGMIKMIPSINFINEKENTIVKRIAPEPVSKPNQNQNTMKPITTTDMMREMRFLMEIAIVQNSTDFSDPRVWFTYIEWEVSRFWLIDTNRNENYCNN